MPFSDFYNWRQFNISNFSNKFQLTTAHWICYASYIVDGLPVRNKDTKEKEVPVELKVRQSYAYILSAHEGGVENA